MADVTVSEFIDSFLRTNSTTTALSALGVPGLEFAPYDAGNKTGNVSLDYLDGSFQKLSATGNITLHAPSGGSEGVRLRLWITASGANRTLSLHNNIKLPSDSGATFPKTLTSDKRYILLLQHDGAAWMLVSLIGGY